MTNGKKSEAPQNVNGHFDVEKPYKVPKDCGDTKQWSPNFFFFFVFALNKSEQREEDMYLSVYSSVVGLYWHNIVIG